MTDEELDAIGDGIGESFYLSSQGMSEWPTLDECKHAGRRAAQEPEVADLLAKKRKYGEVLDSITVQLAQAGFTTVPDLIAALRESERLRVSTEAALRELVDAAPYLERPTWTYRFTTAIEAAREVLAAGLGRSE